MMMSKSIAALLISLWLVIEASVSVAAPINHTFVEQNTRQTHTGDTAFTNVTGAQITSGNFTASKKYLLVVTAQVDIDADSIKTNFRVVHGATPTEFDGSNMQWERSGAAGNRTVYAWWTVWTAVSGEDVTFQFRTANGANTVGANYVSLLAINLSDDVAENTDWFYNEDTGPDTLDTTPVTGGSITFTPSGASDWLVLALETINNTTSSIITTSWIERSGEASSTLPQVVQRHPTGSSDLPWTLARAYSLTAVSNTFQARSSASGTSATRNHSQIFALNLNKFKNRSWTYTEAATSLSATDYATELQSIGITPDVTSNTWILAWFNADLQATNREVEFRVQLDAADKPSGQTTDNYQFRTYIEATSEDPMVLSTMATSLSAASHTIDLDASADSITSTPEAEQRFLLALTMELAGGAPAAGRRRLTTFGVGP